MIDPREFFKELMAFPPYVLNERGEPCRAESLRAMFEWMQADDFKQRSVGHDTINGLSVSTMFLGLPANLWSLIRTPEAVPILWETMIFGGLLDCLQSRCGGSREQALAMHQEAIQIARRDYSRAPWFRALPRKRRRKMVRQLKRALKGYL